MSELNIEMLWGQCRLKVAKWRCPVDTLVVTSYRAGMDQSGLSPEVLKRRLDLSTRLPYREGHDALRIQGLDLGLSRCERLSQRYAQKVVECLEQWVSEVEGFKDAPYKQPESYAMKLNLTPGSSRDGPEPQEQSGY